MTETFRVVITCPHCQREYPIHMGEGRLAELKAKATCSRCGKSFPTAGQVLVEDLDEGLEGLGVFEETTPTSSLAARNTLRQESSMPDPPPSPPPVPPSTGKRGALDAPLQPTQATDRNITAGGLAALLGALNLVAGEKPAESGGSPVRSSTPTADRDAARPTDGEQAEAHLGWEPTAPPAATSPVRKVGSWDTALESALAAIEVPQPDAPVSSETAAAGSGGEVPSPSAGEPGEVPGPSSEDGADAPGPAGGDVQDAAPSEGDEGAAAPGPAASDERADAMRPPEETLELAASLLQRLPLCSSHIELTPFDTTTRATESVAALEWLLDVGSPDQTGSEPKGGHEGT